MTLGQQNIPLFFNPTAGRGRGGRAATSISAALDGQGIAHTLVASRHPGDMEELIVTAIGEGHRKLLVAGGDGSVHEAVNGILGTDQEVEFGVIPVGTGNDFAKACSIPLHLNDAVSLLADRINSGAPSRQIDAGRFNDRYFANGAGIGFDAKVSQIASRIQLPIGDLVYLLAVFRCMWSGIATPEVSLTFGDKQFEGTLTLASFSNGPWVGGMFHMAPQAANDDALLDLVYAEAVTSWRLLGLIPKIIKGTHLNEPEVKSSTVSTCEVIAAAPVPSQLDGENQALQTHFKIEVLAGALHLL
jgi:diacylglycerol kinase (ATP)